MRSIPSSQRGLTLRDFRKMEYLSQVCSDPIQFSDDASLHQCKNMLHGLTD